ncbi:MAG TPA: glycosyltransferase [Candidatus Acidoferrales bacterium]
MSAPQPLVSVVMVVRDFERFVGEAIESILRQTFTDFEFVILDFGSTDRSKAIASAYAARDHRIRLHYANCDLVEARNIACSIATARYIAIQDADDVCLPDRLLRQVEFMQKHADCALLGSAAEWTDAQGTSLFTLDFPTEHDEIRSALVARCAFSHTSVLMRREAFIAVGGYRKAFALAHDYDLFLRISERFQCANLKEVLVKYRLHLQQSSVSKRDQQILCALAARASAACRKNALLDPLNSADTVTPNLLAALGVTPAEIQTSRFRGCRRWVSNAIAAKDYSTAIQIAVTTRKSEWEYVEPRDIAFLHRILAGLYWRNGQFRKSLSAAYHGISLAMDRDLAGDVLRRIWEYAGVHSKAAAPKLTGASRLFGRQRDAN